MKHLFLSTFFVAILFSSMAQTKKPTTTVKKPVTTKPTNSAALKPVTFDDSLSYAIGISVAEFYKEMGVKKMNTTLLSNAIKKVFANDTSRWSDEQVQTFLMQASQKIATEKAAESRKEGNDFLAKNKTKPGVITTESGLQYQILQAGNGEKPSAKDTAVCHYIGKLIDGKEFDNSYKRGAPITFPVTGVIKGWTEALQLMPKGSKWKLFIPADLAYGDRGAGKDIPPGAALVFEVELLDVKKAN